MGRKRYRNPAEIVYYSPRYNKWVTVQEGYLSDGATGAFDVCARAFFVHDWICGNWLGTGPNPPGGQWDDGAPITNWQASAVLKDILSADVSADRPNGRWFRKHTWFWMTWLRGGGKARENGMW